MIVCCDTSSIRLQIPKNWNLYLTIKLCYLTRKSFRSLNFMAEKEKAHSFLSGV